MKDNLSIFFVIPGTVIAVLKEVRGNG